MELLPGKKYISDKSDRTYSSFFLIFRVYQQKRDQTFLFEDIHIFPAWRFSNNTPIMPILFRVKRKQAHFGIIIIHRAELFMG
jgi:hypothetical protein